MSTRSRSLTNLDKRNVELTHELQTVDRMAQQLQKEKDTIICSADEEVKQAKVFCLLPLNNWISELLHKSKFYLAWHNKLSSPSILAQEKVVSWCAVSVWHNTLTVVGVERSMSKTARQTSRGRKIWAWCICDARKLSLIHIWRCRRSTLCRSRWSPDH